MEFVQVVVLPSLDYEVFHGRNFVDDETVLFGPTRRIIEKGCERSIPFTLFADVMCLPPQRAAGNVSFCEGFEEQLLWCAHRGSDVQLHTHAHWADSSFQGGEWRLAHSAITLSDFDYDSGRPEQLVRESMKLLTALMRRADPHYKCVAFRAGGLALEPHSDRLMAILSAQGIKIDSSLAKGLRLQMDTLSIDNRNLPADANWMLHPGIFEIPIASFEMSRVKVAEFLVRRLRAYRNRRGSGISRAARQTRLANGISLVRENLRYISGRPVFLFSADTKGYTRPMLVEGFKRYIRQHSAATETIYVSMINHPKLMFEAQERLLFDVLDDLKQHYGSTLRFSTYRDVARELAPIEEPIGV